MFQAKSKVYQIAGTEFESAAGSLNAVMARMKDVSLLFGSPLSIEYSRKEV